MKLIFLTDFNKNWVFGLVFEATTVIRFVLWYINKHIFTLEVNNIAMDFNSVSITKKDGKIGISAIYSVFVKKEEDSEYYSCAIPAFDLFYTIKNEESAVKRGKAMVGSFLNYYFLTLESNRIKKFGLALHSLGFRAEHDSLVMSDMMKNKLQAAKFKSSQTETDLYGQPVEVESEFEAVV